MLLGVLTKKIASPGCHQDSDPAGIYQLKNYEPCGSGERGGGTRAIYP